MQGVFSFVVQECPECRHQIVETCKDGVIKLEKTSWDNHWRYYCMLCVDEKPVLALEVVKTHLSSVDKVESTRADGIDLAEFLVEDVMSLRSKGGGDLDNLQIKMI
jgi:hypothetical protein